jgi:hypothetical protein
MTTAIDAFRAAVRAAADAKSLISLIGKTAPNTTSARGGLAATAGIVHTITIRTTVAYQEYDGAKNYHESEAFDFALARAVRKHFAELQAEALADLDALAADKKEAARQEYADLFAAELPA